MKIYVASAFDQRWIRAMEPVLVGQGWEVLSTWQWISDAEAAQMTAEQEGEWAIKNLEAVHHADIVLVFAHGQSSGGMWTEMGFALAEGKPIIVVGETQNVFRHRVTVVPEGQWWEAVCEITSRCQLQPFSWMTKVGVQK